MLLETGQSIVFVGDSITDCGRRGPAAPYGDGYVSLVRSLILARYPALLLRFVNRGVGGNTVRDLAARWQPDVLAERPDWLVVMIGINDVWRAFSGNPHEAVPLPEYEATLRRLLEEARSTTQARLVLMEPYMIEPRRNVPMRREMDRFGAAVGTIAVDFAALLVRTQAAWDAALVHMPPEAWADDQVHPNQPGHTLIALALLHTLGFSL